MQIINWLHIVVSDDTDDDGDGVLDGDEDDDGDGVENDEDSDDDGDGVLDVNDELFSRSTWNPASVIKTILRSRPTWVSCWVSNIIGHIGVT